MDPKMIYSYTVAGKIEQVPALVEQALAEGNEASRIIDDFLVPAMKEVGDRFERQEYYLPEMLAAAEATKRAMAILKPRLAAGERKSQGRVVAGTVQGDLHDIGKNLVCAMLEGAGFTVIDLGVDVSAEKYLEAIQEQQPDIVAMSALLSTTKNSMPEIIQALKDAGVRSQVRIMVGGAPITQEYCDRIGADGYAPDAASAVRRAKELLA